MLQSSQEREGGRQPKERVGGQLWDGHARPAVDIAFEYPPALSRSAQDNAAKTPTKGRRMPGRSSQTRKSTSYTSSNSPLPQSNFPGHHLLLDPRFLIQLAVLLLSVAGLYYGLVAKQDNLAKEQLRQGSVLDKMESRLPNNEALELRLKQIENDVATLRGQVRDFDGWVRITREQMAADKASKSNNNDG